MLRSGDEGNMMDNGTVSWLLSAPQFWLGFVACAVLVFLAVLPGALFPRKRVIVYSIPDHAPIPSRDPFYKPGSEKRVPNRAGTALRENREKLKELRPAHGEYHSPQPKHISEARKRAVWHPHPDDALPSWGSW